VCVRCASCACLRCLYLADWEMQLGAACLCGISPGITPSCGDTALINLSQDVLLSLQGGLKQCQSLRCRADYVHEGTSPMLAEIPFYVRTVDVTFCVLQCSINCCFVAEGNANWKRQKVKETKWKSSTSNAAADF
jgi:hypothetical protein